MRRPILAGNWKMHKTCSETFAFATQFCPLVQHKTDVDIVLCPPYTSLEALVGASKGTNVDAGAQDVFWKESGAYTGQISAGMLVDLGVKYAIIGHSESRGRFGVPEPDFNEDILRYFGDTNESVNRKLKASLAAGLVPIVCVGETIHERRAGTTDIVVDAQVIAALTNISSEDGFKIVFAYEPVWAIGTGEMCGPIEADRVCGIIRTSIGAVLGEDAADAIRIQYGGSVKPDNVAELMSQPNIDGALVGGASLKPTDFAAIVNAA